MINTEEIKCAIIALKNAEDNKKQIMHFRWYQFEPTELDFKKLREDLTTVETHGLVGQMDDILLSLAPPAVVQHYVENFFKKETAIEDLQEVKPVKVVKAKAPKVAKKKKVK